MNKLSVFIFLFFFSFTTISNAENVEDFEIEGITVGDSLLDYFTKKEIAKIINDPNTNNLNDIFYQTEYLKNAKGEPLEQYDYISLLFKRSSKYTIKGLVGAKMYTNINECVETQNEIVNEMSEIFEDETKLPSPNPYSIIFRFQKSGDAVEVTCVKENDVV